ncbi:MAG: YtxH domain-containing protein [Phototrophicaceae bacterium]|jgi:gas vesicle protein
MNNDRIYYSHDAEAHALQAMTRLMVLCLLIGLGIGATIALFFSPVTSKAARDRLSKTVEQGWSDGRDAVEPMLQRVEKEFTGVRKTIDDRLKHD